MNGIRLASELVTLAREIAAKRITVHYDAVDGYHEKRSYSTVEKARNYAWKWVGKHPEVGFGYAVSTDGVGKVSVDGITIEELFRTSADEKRLEREEYESNLKRAKGLFAEIAKVVAKPAVAVLKKAGLDNVKSETSWDRNGGFVTVHGDLPGWTRGSNNMLLQVFVNYEPQAIGRFYVFWRVLDRENTIYGDLDFDPRRLRGLDRLLKEKVDEKITENLTKTLGRM